MLDPLSDLLLWHCHLVFATMMTPVCPRLLNLNNYFVLLRFWARAPEDLSAIEVIYIIIIIYYYDVIE